MLKALGVKWGPTHTEIMATADGPRCFLHILQICANFRYNNHYSAIVFYCFTPIVLFIYFSAGLFVPATDAYIADILIFSLSTFFSYFSFFPVMIRRLIEVNARFHAANTYPLVRSCLGYDSLTATMDSYFNPGKVSPSIALFLLLFPPFFHFFPPFFNFFIYFYFFLSDYYFFSNYRIIRLFT